MTCPRCGLVPVPTGFVACISCCVELNYDVLVADRSRLADWLVKAEHVLSSMSQVDPRWAEAKKLWDKRHRDYMALATLVPEV